jgi:hypothetical protein
MAREHGELVGLLSNRQGSSQAEMQSYIAALKAQIQGQDPIEALEEFPGILEATVANVSHETMLRTPPSGGWCALQVIEHLADHEMIVGYRVRMIVAEDRPIIPGFDQDAWATRLKWQHRSVAQSMAAFKALRNRNLQLFCSIDQADLARFGIHAERGEESVQHFIELTAGHDRAHLAQIERILASVANATEADKTEPGAG